MNKTRPADKMSAFPASAAATPSQTAGSILRVMLLVLICLFFWTGTALAAEAADTGAGTEEGAVTAAGPAEDPADTAGVIEDGHENAADLAAEPGEDQAQDGGENTATAVDAATVDSGDPAAAVAPDDGGSDDAASAADEPCDCDEDQPAEETAKDTAQAALAGAQPQSASAGSGAGDNWSVDIQVPKTESEDDCEEIKKILELICGEGEWGVYWESKADYEDGLLSIRYRLRNISDDQGAFNLRVDSATATNGVKVHTILPLQLGSLDPGDWLYFTLKWEIPSGVKHFVTDIVICGDCEEVCDDCEPPVCDDCEPPVCDDCEPQDIDGGPDIPTTEVKQPQTMLPATVAPLQASALPDTGFGLAAALMVGLFLTLTGALVPAVVAVRQRKR